MLLSSFTKITNNKCWLDFFLISIVLFTACALWLPGVNSNLPFFYNEDEAHHFNRSVEMLQTGNLNPKYFHKPSLPTYTRLPFIFAGFIWDVRKGRVQKIEEVRTRDSFGLAGYNFTASHPNLVKAARLPSLIFSLLSIILLYKIADNIFKSKAAAFLSSALFVLSPELITGASLISVDLQTSFFCLLTLYLCQQEKVTFNIISAAAFCAGLAISSKYNIFPIALAPILTMLLREQFNLKTIAACLFLPIFGFFIGSPYILAEVPLFINQFAYEVYHYGVAGHAELTHEPGIPMMLHYFSWVFGTATSKAAAILILPGVFGIIYFAPRKILPLIFFSFIYFLMMSAQKAGFTRNLIPLIPLFCLCSTASVLLITKLIPERVSKTTFLLLSAILAGTAFFNCTSSLSNTDKPETRNLAYAFINNLPEGDTVISGELQLPLFTAQYKGEKSFLRKGVKRLKPEEIIIKDLYQQGFEYLIVGPEWKEEPKGLELVKTFPGFQSEQRVIENPEIRVFKFQDLSNQLIEAKEVPARDFEIERYDDTNQVICRNPETGEKHCWLTSRLNKFNLRNLVLSGATSKFSINLMPTWKNQSIEIISGEYQTKLEISENFGEFQELAFEIPNSELLKTNGFIIKIAKLSVPALNTSSTDERRLGAAFE